MKQQFTLCATLLALGIGGIGTASAQPYYYVGPRPPAYVGPRMYGPGLPPHEIIAIVRAAGLVPLTQPVRRGPRAYVLVAAGRAGEQVRVVVDAYAGDILRVNPVVAMRPYGAPVAAYPYDPRPRGALVQREIAPVQREIKDPPPGTYPPSARFDNGLRRRCRRAAFPMRVSPMHRPRLRTAAGRKAAARAAAATAAQRRRRSAAGATGCSSAGSDAGATSSRPGACDQRGERVQARAADDGAGDTARLARALINRGC